MRVLGILLLVLGIGWVILCFVGIQMMARSVDMFREAFLPSLPGAVLACAGLWILFGYRRGPANHE